MVSGWIEVNQFVQIRLMLQAKLATTPKSVTEGYNFTKLILLLHKSSFFLDVLITNSKHCKVVWKNIGPRASEA